MLHDFLKQNYYLDEKGEPDQIIKKLGDCLTRNVFFVLSNYSDNKKRLYLLFLDIFNGFLVLDNHGEINNINIDTFQELNSYIKVNDKNFLENMGNKAISDIEKLVSENKIVLINTSMDKLSFYKDFEKMLESKDGVKKSPKKEYGGHYFLILGMDDKYFYFLENHINVIKKNFIPHEKNREIGKVLKGDCYDAFNAYINYFTIEPDVEMLNGISYRLITGNLQKCIINYYDNPLSYSNGYVKYSGKQMIENMIGLCYGNNKNLDFYPDVYKDSKNENDIEFGLKKNIFQMLNRVIGRIINRRKLYRYYFEMYEGNEDFLKIINLINKSIECWDGFKNILYYQFESQNYKLDSSYIELLNRILKTDNELCDHLGKNMVIIEKIFNGEKEFICK